MDGGNGVKTIVYNAKKDSKKGTQEKKTRKKKERERAKGWRNTTVKGRIQYS